jgi:hypothetical protein
MRKLVLILTGIIFLTDAFSESIGISDNRVYVSDAEWKTYPYNLTVSMLSDSGKPKCTAQYSYTDLLTTSDHCIIGSTATFRGPNGTFTADLVARGYAMNPAQKMVDPKNDWAIYKITNPEYFSKSKWFNVSPNSNTYYKQVQVAGFSDLRIINNLEVTKIKNITVELLKNKDLLNGLTFDRSANTQAVSASDVQLTPYTDFVNALNDELAKQKIPPIYGDARHLKVDKSCSVVELNSDRNQLGHNCDGSMGSSGSALVVNDASMGFKIVGIQSRSSPTIGNQNSISSNINAYAAQTEYFYNVLQKLISDGNNPNVKPNIFIPDCKNIEQEWTNIYKDYVRAFYSKWLACKNGGKLGQMVFEDDYFDKQLFASTVDYQLSISGKKPITNITFDCINPTTDYIVEIRKQVYTAQETIDYFKKNINCTRNTNDKY